MAKPVPLVLAATIAVAAMPSPPFHAMQAAPVTADRSLDTPPFDRQQVAGSVGGPLRKGNLFGFGAVEYRMALSGTGKSFPRCDKHWGERLETQEQINERYPTLAPSNFDPADAGERWDDEY